VFNTGKIEQATVKEYVTVIGQRRDWTYLKYQVGSDPTVYQTMATQDALHSLPVGSTFRVRIGQHLTGAALIMPIIKGHPAYEFYDQLEGLFVGILIGFLPFYFNVLEPASMFRLLRNGVATQGVVTKINRMKRTKSLCYSWEDEKGQPHESRQTIRTWVPTRFQEGQAIQVLFYPGTSKSTVYELAEYEVAL